MRLRSASFFFSNVPLLKFLPIHLLSMKLASLQQAWIHPCRGLNRLLCPTNGSVELFVEEECQGRVPTGRF